MSLSRENFAETFAFLPRKSTFVSEAISPTQLQTYGLCARKWGFAYLAGLREPETKAQRLGTSVHSECERHAWALPMSYANPEASRIAVSGLHLWPRLDLATQIECEGNIVIPGQEPPKPKHDRDTSNKISISIDTRRLFGGLEPLQIVGYCDLAVGYSTGWIFVDFKTCRNFRYQKTAEELLRDPQAVLYGLHFLWAKNISDVLGRWIYHKTEGAAEARETDFSLERTHTEQIATEILRPGFEMRAARREKIKPEELPANTQACASYGGCPFSRARGGPCRAEVTSIFSTLDWTKPVETLKEKLARLQGATAPTPTPTPAPTPVLVQKPLNLPKPVIPPSPIHPPETVTVESSEEESDTIPPPPPPPAKGPGRPKGAKNKPATVEAEPLPPGTDYAKRTKDLYAIQGYAETYTSNAQFVATSAIERAQEAYSYALALHLLITEE